MRSSDIRALVTVACAAPALGLGVAVAAAWPVPDGVRAARVVHRHKCVHPHGHHRRRCAKRRRSSGDTMNGHRQAPASPSSPAPTDAPALVGSLLPSSPGLAPPAPPESGAEAPQGGEVGEPPSVPHVQVSAVEYAFTLSRTTVPAGKVIVQFVNDGQDEHNLKLAAAEEGQLVGSFEKLPAKGVSNLTLEMQPGEYTLFCSLPTHEQKGMKATLTVE